MKAQECDNCNGLVYWNEEAKKFLCDTCGVVHHEQTE